MAIAKWSLLLVTLAALAACATVTSPCQTSMSDSDGDLSLTTECVF